MTEPADKPASKVPGREALHAPLPKRFYQKVDVREEPGGGFAVLLDGRAVRTPKKLPLQVPTRALAEAIAAEWSAQTERIDPGTMPLSKIAITTIDGVEQNAAEVAAEIVRFAGSDLLCYRAEAPVRARRPPVDDLGSDPALDRGGDRRAVPAGRGRDAGDAEPAGAGGLRRAAGAVRRLSRWRACT